MNVLSLIKNWMYALMRIIDNGKFFIKPQKWVYFLFGILAFVVPLVVTYLIYDSFDDFIGPLDSGWDKFVGFVGITLFFIYLYLTAFLIFFFWKSRIANIDAHVKVGDNIVAIPLWAHAIKSYGECLGMYIGLLPPVGGALLYLFCLLTGEMDFYHDWLFLIYLLAWILLTVASVYLAWIVISFFRFISECISIRPQIANDVRDLGDIHRAAVMPEENKQSEEI